MGDVMRKTPRTLVGMCMAVAAVVMTASPAHASYSNVVYVATGLEPAPGKGTFSADPHGRIPGDAIRACDVTRDGWGVKAWLYVNHRVIRTASTLGHRAMYCTRWKTGNLKEEQLVTLRVCLVKKGREPYRCAHGRARS
ncbi:hypothetical protein LIX60_05185 [Streptomyces sp. S07_1.15]|uniref:hypothetical protein n=1 Tax=Streptomyces sp. S07_1.15 TaxID=2873925 RepID=UPI001D1583D2|nr:hypothetical protein [Streptomyces sp. S07_1.15]MCC3650879.1 hypothetical protein [Streptomyces sp. S07_1.15]